MKKQLVSASAIFSLLILLVSCSKDKNGSSINYKVKTENRTSTVGRVTAGTINWTSGSAFADKIEFEAEKNDDDEVEFESRVGRRIDLFASVSDLGSISLAQGRYEEIEIELDLAPSGSDTAFLLRGSYTNSASVTTPVVFFINELIEFKAEAEDVNVSSDNDFSALTTLNLALLTSGITEAQLDNATSTNGVIVISKSSNTGLYSTLLSNLQNMDSVEIDD
jgi:hypothetical protein